MTTLNCTVEIKTCMHERAIHKWFFYSPVSPQKKQLPENKRLPLIYI